MDRPPENQRPLLIEARRDRDQRLVMLKTLAALAALALAFFAVFWTWDLAVRPQGMGRDRWTLFFQFDTETLQNTLGSLAQIIVAVLGIAITVVSIVVQLAATRYSSHIASMFFHDRTNLAVMAFFVVACLDVVWVSLGVHSDYTPRVSVVVSLVVISASLLLLIPYFAYVFEFLDPARVVSRIGAAVLRATPSKKQNQDNYSERQQEAAVALERLADVAVNSVAQNDKVIATQTVNTLRSVLIRYLESKKDLPDSWFALGPWHRQDADFAAMEAGSGEVIEHDKIWLEWKGLRQLRGVFDEASQRLPEVAHSVAIATRAVGEKAIEGGDQPVVAIVLKFFNTYLRTALNTRDVRSAYNVLNEYRQLAENVMERDLGALAEEIAGHFKYYGQTAHAMGLGFVTETVAYDLSVLCENAFNRRAGCHGALLRTFLEVDKEAETSAEEQALRGVRKAQVRLATHYLVNDADALARTIFEDMKHEVPARLGSIRQELMAVTKKDFWEVTDRGVNFDYLNPRRRAQLDVFFEWFDSAPTRTYSTIPPLPPAKTSMPED